MDGVIWDTFMFRDEYDMLECRLYEMQDRSNIRHVLVEAPVDHRGNPKPLYFSENRGRFAPWKDRITSVVAGSLPDTSDPWVREHAQRDAARPVIVSAAGPSDVVIIADVDEIPSPQVLDTLDWYKKAWAPRSLRVAFHQRVFAFAVDWELPRPEPTSLAVSTDFLDTPLGVLRDARYGWGYRNAGWHLSWLGGKEAILAKVRSHCHTEQDEILIQRAEAGQLYEQGAGIWGAGVSDGDLVPVDVDETWPRYIYERRCPETWFRPR